ncbi:MAG: AccI family restriction endonuclease [Ktedonobacterales bacterium]
MDESALPFFERILSVSEEESDWELARQEPIPWDDFWLNPRRLRGSDFLMRWSQGEWSEKRLIQAVNESADFAAIPYGPSGVAPEGDVRAFELYFERLESAGLGQMKRPDVLIVRKSNVAQVERIVARLGGEEMLPFTSEDHSDMKEL